MKHLFVTALLGASLAVNASEPIADQTVLVKNEDPEMAQAITTAQRTLDEFLKIAANPPAGTSGFKLKVRLQDGPQSEHMWVAPFRVTPDGFLGILANDPSYIKNVKLGQRVSFKRSEVSDWGYVQDGKQKGSFTVCVVLKHLPKSEAQRYRTDYGFDC